MQLKSTSFYMQVIAQQNNRNNHDSVQQEMSVVIRESKPVSIADVAGLSTRLQPNKQRLLRLKDQTYPYKRAILNKSNLSTPKSNSK